MMVYRMMCVAIVASLISGCTAKDDEAAINQLVDKSVSLAEEKKIGSLLELTTDRFVAQPGHHDALAVKGILFRAFMYYGVFKIYHPKPEIMVDASGVQASATLYFVVIKQNQAFPDIKALYDSPALWLEKVSEKADLYRLEMDLTKTNSDWLVSQVRLEGFKGAGF